MVCSGLNRNEACGVLLFSKQVLSINIYSHFKNNSEMQKAIKKHTGIKQCGRAKPVKSIDSAAVKQSTRLQAERTDWADSKTNKTAFCTEKNQPQKSILAKRLYCSSYKCFKIFICYS